tara:strand:+ start:27 stop:530 length:504 start_codon:yes stop_codon:yes gene_type:complete
MKYILILIFLIKPLTGLAENKIGEITGKPLPRYVSLKSSEANLRIGPNKDYPVIIKYTKKNIPLLVIDEFELFGDQWRKVIDQHRNEGWIWRNLLSNKRYAVIKKTNSLYADIFRKPNKKIIGKIGHGNIIKLSKCVNNWCRIKIDKHKGWIKKDNIWGVFDNEVFD